MISIAVMTRSTACRKLPTSNFPAPSTNFMRLNEARLQAVSSDLISGGVDDDFHRRDDEVHRVPEASDVEFPRPVDELHEIERGQVAGGVVRSDIWRCRR